MIKMKEMLRAYGLLALVILVLSEVLLFTGAPWVGEWFYLLAWWPYIFFVDWLVKRKTGNSLILDRTKEFLALIPWSTFIWLIFEWFNLFLKNWHYVDLTPNIFLRWLGYFLSYGTVLPGLFETYELLEAYGVLKNIRPRALSSPERLYPWFTLLGILFLLLPVAYPRYFFPLVWGGFFFLLEPINHALSAPSILRDWQEGNGRKFYLFLLSGLICGFLWEFWNYWAISKWVYTVPFVGKVKLFEMPVLGFLGFPPFAVECYVMMNFINLFRGGRSWERGAPRPRVSFHVPWWAFLVLHLAFDAYVFRQIDLHTVVSYLP